VSTRFVNLAEAISDPVFPDVDLALRRGRHIDREDGEWYAFVIDAQDHLEQLYRRYGCELVTQSDGYFYLLPTGDRMSRRHLSAGEMLLGQTLALLYLDPSTVQSGGIVLRDHALTRLAGLVSDRDLAKALEPRRRRFDDERVVHEIIRKRLTEAVRRLASLGFLEILDEERLRLRSPLLRFADGVRGLEDSEAALERLIASGQVVVPDAPDAFPDREAGGPDVEFDDNNGSDEELEVEP
jgi:chromosome partition protein MukE